MTIDEVVEVAEKNEENMEEVLQPYVQSMAKTVQFFIKSKSKKYLKMNFHMELTMEQMIN